MSRLLPPMSTVRVFEAAARHLNFTRAGDELAMTQAAVSYQIKVLEDRIGGPVFQRGPRGVALTPRGLRFQRGAADALALLSDAFAAARDEGREILTLSVAPTFASEFLARRLGAFQLAHPDIAVRVVVDQALTDFSETDVAIRYGLGDWPGLTATYLLDASASPMLTPALARTIGGVRDVADLVKLPRLEPDDPWWSEWFEKMGGAPVDPADASGISFGAQNLEAAAALAGHGVGRLTPLLFREALREGRLIQPFADTHGDGRAFWLVCPEGRAGASKSKAFREWLLSEVEAEVALSRETG